MSSKSVFGVWALGQYEIGGESEDGAESRMSLILGNETQAADLNGLGPIYSSDGCVET